MVELCFATADFTLHVEEVSQPLTVENQVQELVITKDGEALSIAEVVQTLITANNELGLDVTEETPTLVGVLDPVSINQYFSGEGAVADGTTILGLGITADPLRVEQDIVSRALGAFQITNNLGEIPTQMDRLNAQQNLGLHIIDGGTF